MRQDFNKQLTERERIGHGAKYHEVRGGKLNSHFDEDAKGGKESIHAGRRRAVKVNRKSFNENLNPLRSFIHRNVGRPWNKVFSELNQVFDRRKVVNNHIFEHLLDYVETQAKLIDGRVCVLNSYRNYRPYDPVTRTYGEVEEGYYDKRWTPIKEDSCEWYVHPVDGLLKANKNKIGKKARREKQAKAREAAALKVSRVVDADNHLYLEDGIWMLYGIKDKPAPVETFVAPYGMTDWDFRKLSKAEREKVGVKRMERPSVNEFYPNTGRGAAGTGRYYATKQTANRKLLKQLGLDGTAAFDDETVPGMSHREFNKYQKAA